MTEPSPEEILVYAVAAQIERFGYYSTWEAERAIWVALQHMDSRVTVPDRLGGADE